MDASGDGKLHWSNNSAATHRFLEKYKAAVDRHGQTGSGGMKNKGWKYLLDLCNDDSELLRLLGASKITSHRPLQTHWSEVLVICTLLVYLVN